MATKRYCRQNHDLLESPAYRDLNPPARALLMEFQIIYLPSWNGKLSISVRNAAKRIRVSERTAQNAFRDLAEHGFIKMTKPHQWLDKRAREWRLTIDKTESEPATHDWKTWEPGKRVFTIPKHRQQKNSRPHNLLQSVAI